MSATRETDAVKDRTGSESLAAAVELLAPLKRAFGHGGFRPMQQKIVEDAVAGRDVLVILPTGGGKSLCYQLPAVAEGAAWDEANERGEAEGRRPMTVVVSPLIALMENQVEALKANGVKAGFLNSSMDFEDARRVQHEAESGELDLVYLAPERMMSEHGRNWLARLNVARFAIDEAHCISAWGHDFRPEYRMLGELRTGFGGRFKEVPVMALTATATPRVADDVVTQLHLGGDRRPGDEAGVAVHRGGFERPNLFYEVRPKRKVVEQIAAMLEADDTAEGIVYCGSRKKCEEISEQLRAAGLPALPYHAGLDAETRSKNQHDFIYGNCRVVVATIAFGMGVDKPDVRFVVHADLPQNLEGYYQETGRAGRDGLPGKCVLFYSGGDRARVEFFINRKEDIQEREHATEQLEKMIKYCHTTGCRTAAVLAHFGDELAPVAPATGAHAGGEEGQERPPGKCGHCDNCVHPPKTRDVTQDARKLLSTIARTGQRYGLGYAFDVLRGSRNTKVMERGHDELSVHGIGKDQPVGHWRALAEHLVQEGHLTFTNDGYRVALLTASSKDVLKGEVPVELAISRAVDPKAGGPESGRMAQGKKRRAAAAQAELSPEAADLFEKLRSLRAELAEEQGVPPYIVFGDATLLEMATRRPSTDHELLAISGVGQTKLQRYGDAFRQAIREA